VFGLTYKLKVLDNVCRFSGSLINNLLLVGSKVNEYVIRRQR